MDKKIKKLIRLEELKRDLAYENQEGEHTFHMCTCNRRGCRSEKCQICIEEEIKSITDNTENAQNNK